LSLPADALDGDREVVLLRRDFQFNSPGAACSGSIVRRSINTLFLPNTAPSPFFVVVGWKLPLASISPSAL
jgi:hypothetical protein